MELADFHTATWDRLALWATGELEALRKNNDAKKLTAEETAFLRGEIAFVKKLIGLPESLADKGARERAEPATDY